MEEELLKYKITLDYGDLKGGVKGVNSAFDDLKRASNGAKSGLNSISNMMKSTARESKKASSGVAGFTKNVLAMVGLGKVIGVVTSSLDSAIARMDTINNYGNMMSNMNIGAEQSAQSIEMLKDGLDGLPTKLDDAVKSVAMFTSANDNITGSTQMYLALNNAILAGGASMQQQQSAMEQLSQAYLKGKPDMMEWRTAMMTMPAQMKQVATAMGFVNADALGESLRNGNTSMQEFMNTIMRLNNEGLEGFQSFSDQARNSTGGVATSIANMRNAVVRGLADVMDAIGRSNIAGFFQGITRAINVTFKYIVAFIGAIKTAIGMLGALFGKTTKGADTTTKATTSAGASIGDMSTDIGGADKGMNNLGKSAKKTAKEVKKLSQIGLDELNVLTQQEQAQDTGGSGGGGVGGDIGGGGLGDFGDLEFPDYKAKIKEALDFSKVFDELATNINAGLHKLNQYLDWNIIGDTITGWIDNITGTFNKLVGAIDFKLLGNVIGNGINTAFQIAYQFVTKIDWGLITTQVANALKGALEKIDFYKVGYVVASKVYGFPKLILSFLSKVDWSQIGLATSNFLMGALDFINFPQIGSQLGTMITGMFQGVLTFAQNFNWLKLGSDIANGINNAIKNIDWKVIMASIGAGIMGILDSINAFFKSIDWVALGKSLYDAILYFFTEIDWLGIVASLIDTLGAIIKGLLEVIAGFFIQAWEHIKTATVEYFQGMWDGVVAIWNIVATWFKENVIDPVVNFFSEMIENIKLFFSNCWEGIKEIWNVVATWFNDTVIEPVKRIFDDMLTNVKQFFADAWQGIKDIWSLVIGWFTSTIIDPLRNKFNELKEAIKNFFTDAWNGVKNIWNNVSGWFKENVTDKISNAFSDAIENIKNFFSGLWTFITNLFAKGGQIFDGLVSGMKNIFTGVVNLLIDGINNVINAPVGFINGILNGIRNFDIPIIGKPFAGLWGNDPIPKANIPRLADGGIVYGNSLVNVAEYENASRNPEVIAPLDKLQNMINNKGNNYTDEIMIEELREMNRRLRAIEDKDTNVYLDDEQVNKTLDSRKGKINRQKGRGFAF